jgi:NAD(P)H-quinone oxidoreductase subunit 5
VTPDLIERACLAAAVLTPLAGAVAVRARDGRRTAVIVSWTAAGAALAVLGLVAVRGPAPVWLVAGPGGPPLNLVASPVTAALLTLICGVGALVQSFAARYLRADAAADRFAIRALVVVSAMAGVASAATLAGLIAAWIVAGVGFVAVTAYRPDLPGVGDLARTAGRALVVGDGCLAVAGAIVSTRAGNPALAAGALSEAAARLGSWRPVVAVLVVVAVAARSAQGIFRRWLARTVAAPTPASALLHAGVVNGGGILLIRLGVLAAWPPAQVALIVVAAGTAVWAGAVLTFQSDIKGQLAASTASQMGFMLAECGAGAWAAAMIHLIGHGLYKASLFLSSGSAAARPAPGRPAPGPDVPRRTAATAVTTVAAAAAVAPGLLAGDGWVLAGYAGLSALAIARAWWAGRPAGGPARLAWPSLLVAAAAAYGAAAAAAGRFLLPALPPSAAGLGTAWLLVPAAGAAAVALLTRSGRLGLALRLRLARAADTGSEWQRPVPGRRTAPRRGTARDGIPVTLGTETA